MNATHYTTKELHKKLTDRLISARLNEDMTQAQLAERAGVSRGTVVALEKGESISMANLIKILHELKLLEAVVSTIPDLKKNPIYRVKGRHLRKRASGNLGKSPVDKRFKWRDEQ